MILISQDQLKYHTHISKVFHTICLYMCRSDSGNGSGGGGGGAMTWQFQFSILFRKLSAHAIFAQMTERSCRGKRKLIVRKFNLICMSFSFIYRSKTINETTYTNGMGTIVPTITITRK